VEDEQLPNKKMAIKCMKNNKDEEENYVDYKEKHECSNRGGK
jgi:hypothetical protein